MQKHRIATVLPLRSVRLIDRGFDYLADSFPSLTLGDIVIIPFGRSTETIYGVVSLLRDDAPTMELKPITQVLDSRFRLPEEHLSLVEYLRKHCFCTASEVIRTILPSGIRLKIKEEYICDTPSSLPEADGTKDYVKVRSEDEFFFCPTSALKSLLKRGIIKKEYRFDYSVNTKTQKKFRLIRSPVNETLLPVRNREKYLKLISCFSDNLEKGLEFKEIHQLTGLSKSPLDRLVALGIVEEYESTIYRSSYEEENTSKEEIRLNPEQEIAYKAIAEASRISVPDAFLLHGVTGSGKTKVLLRVIDELLAQGKTVIYLVPEISLTSQGFRLLSGRYANKVAVIHSGLSEGERADAWFQIRSGEKRVILGTRSAVFSPCANLGAIILDEEHDSSYKSDASPRYHARDVARFRCVKNNALLILSSATPDVESFYKAKTGKYKLLSLRTRYNNAPLPKVQIQDIRRDLRENPQTVLGTQLKSQIALNLQRNEQTILFIDRRGYQRFASCLSCGHVPTCPSCSVSLTLHNTNGKRLVCHYCGYFEKVPEECPSCHSKHLLFHGYGSQKAEEELKKEFPDARILRMDADSVTKKMSHEKLLSAFKNHEADILLGTQMVAKGHDFPLVTLVGVVMADTTLYMSDYRAYEHSFSLLTQVIGRAGRSKMEGRAFIQTLNPYHEILNQCTKQDYESFYDAEIRLRKALVYPPFCSICLFGFASENENAISKAAEDFNQELQKRMGEDPDLKLIVYGPLDAPIYKLKNVYRKRYVIKYRADKGALNLFHRLLEDFDKKYKDSVKIHVDINPSLV